MMIQEKDVVLGKTCTIGGAVPLLVVVEAHIVAPGAAESVESGVLSVTYFVGQFNVVDLRGVRLGFRYGDGLDANLVGRPVKEEVLGERADGAHRR